MNFPPLVRDASLAFFLISASALAAGSLTAQRSLKPEDFAQFRDVDEPNISRDGSLIAYAKWILWR